MLQELGQTGFRLQKEVTRSPLVKLSKLAKSVATSFHPSPSPDARSCFTFFGSVCYISSFLSVVGDKDGSKVTTVVATPGQGPDRPQEVSYTDTKVIGNGSFGVVYQAKLCDSGELVAIKKVLQDKRFKVRQSPVPTDALSVSARRGG